MVESRMKENCLNKLLSPSCYTFALGLILLFACLSAPATEEPSLKAERDFQDLSQLMQQSHQPVLVAFVAEYCGYCRQLEKDQLKPLVKKGDYTTRIFIRTVDIADTETLLNFKGEQVSPSDFANQYHADITPTLVFLDHTGQEIAERLVGYNSPDFYGAYLESAIEQAINHRQSAMQLESSTTVQNQDSGKDLNKDDKDKGSTPSSAPPFN